MTSFGAALLVVDAHFLCGAGGAGDVPAGTEVDPEIRTA